MQTYVYTDPGANLQPLPSAWINYKGHLEWSDTVMFICFADDIKAADELCKAAGINPMKCDCKSMDEAPEIIPLEEYCEFALDF